MIIRLSTGASVEFTQCGDRWHWEYWQAGRVPYPFMGSKDGEGFPSLDGAIADAHKTLTSCGILCPPVNGRA